VDLALGDQIKRINLYLLSLFIFLIIFNVSTFAYSQSQNLTNPEPMKQKDLVDSIFDNSLTSMLLSTFIIAIVGVLITKLRNFKKKLDMIEILTKSQVKMKQQAEEREKRFEDKFIRSNDAVAKQIGDLCDKMDKKTEQIEFNIARKTEQLEFKIDNVERNATSTLLRYFSENSVDRKRE
jgi:hypothetical protein